MQVFMEIHENLHKNAFKKKMHLMQVSWKFRQNLHKNNLKFNKGKLPEIIITTL